MVRVLVLGAAGMLGHKVYQTLNQRFEVWGTVRSDYERYRMYGLFARERLVESVDASDFDSVMRALLISRAQVVVNCIGIIKQLSTANDPIISLTVNSLFPHRLASLCQAANIRLIHISTDCVFSGQKGMYTESDVSDAEDLYGKSKSLGEVGGEGCLTLRTSIIGRELNTKSGLVEWFLSQSHGHVRGYTHAVFSGFTTYFLSQIIGDLIEKHVELEGIYNVSSDPISKYELLRLLRSAYHQDVEIDPYSEVRIDRSLNSSHFRQLCGYTPPSWEDMVLQMASDPFYEALQL